MKPLCIDLYCGLGGWSDHHASKKHLFRYIDEFAWRLNEGDVKRHTLERLASFVDAIVGKRITYKQLIAPVEVTA